MKINKKISLIIIALIGLSVLILSAEQATTKQISRNESFEVNLGGTMPKGSKLVEVKKDDPPPLFQFLLESDYVVIASGTGLRAIGKRDKKPIGSKEFDMNEWGAGAVYSISVENILYSKKAFVDNDVPIPVHALETFAKSGTSDGAILKGTRYLLFLKQIPKDDEIFTKLELDRDRSYYRPVVGRESIYPHIGPSMEGPSKIGEINLSSGFSSKLAENIQKICEAFSLADNDGRIKNLNRLAKSNDTFLRENAEYAIRFLSAKTRKQSN